MSVSLEKYKAHYQSGAWKSAEGIVGITTLTVGVLSLAVAVAAFCLHRFGIPSAIKTHMTHLNARGLTVITGSAAGVLILIASPFLHWTRKDAQEFKKAFPKECLADDIARFERGIRREFDVTLQREGMKAEAIITQNRIDITKMKMAKQ